MTAVFVQREFTTAPTNPKAVHGLVESTQVAVVLGSLHIVLPKGLLGQLQ